MTDIIKPFGRGKKGYTSPEEALKIAQGMEKVERQPDENDLIDKLNDKAPFAYVTRAGTSNLSKIYLYREGKPDILLIERDVKINALCSSSDHLWDAGQDGNIRYTLSDAISRSSKNTAVLAICMHEGRRYDAGEYRTIVMMPDDPVAKRDQITYALCSYKDILYDASELQVYDTLKGDVVAKFDRNVHSLCSHEGSLYAGTENGLIYGIDVEQSRNELEKKGMFTEPIHAMISNSGRLLAGGSFGIWDVTNDKYPVDMKNSEERVQAMCNIPFRQLESIITVMGKKLKKR